jgi:predicted nucleic acid-binding protein
MPTIADTGYLFALADTKDIHHQSAIDVAGAVSDTIILPVTVLVEHHSYHDD